MDDDEGHTRESFCYPEMFPMSFSHSEFPESEASQALVGMPFGFLVTPFIPSSDRSQIQRNGKMSTSATRIARCSNCAAYINPFCDSTSIRWICSLCGTRNSFSRSMLRYRKVDLRMLPEMQNLMIDYPLPISDDGTYNQRSGGSLSCPAHNRPFVHVFLVQESMTLDCLQATIEALTEVSKCLHPDVEVVLLTFSNRIGLYRLRGSKGAACVQYVHFTTEHSGSTIALDGQDGTIPSVAGGTACPLLPMEEAALFADVSLPIGECRENFQTALSSLHDASPSASSCALSGPLVLLGPALEEVVSWICDAPIHQNKEVEKDGVSSAEVAPTRSGFIGLLTGLGILGGEDYEEARDEWDIGKRGQPIGAAIDDCTGVVLHLMLSSNQDLTSGSHDSVGITTATGHSRPSLSEDWVKNLATKCARSGLGVNVWGLADFDSSNVSLSQLMPLTTLTGGKVYRFTLGTDPSAERLRLTTQMVRTVSSQVASKCLLRMRASSVIDEKAASTAIGHCMPDEELPDVYRVALCSPDSAYSYMLQYSSLTNIESDKYRDRSGKHRNVAVQIAFSYSTLVEVSVDTSDRRGENYRFNGSDSESEDDAALSSTPDRSICDMSEKVARKYEEYVCNTVGEGKSYEEAKKYNSWLMKKGGKDKFSSNISCIYGHDKQLVAVRRLRVITCMIECTNKLPRLLKCVHIPTMATLIVRSALKSTVNQDRNTTIEEWCDRVVVSVCHMIWAHRHSRDMQSRDDADSILAGESDDMTKEIVNSLVEEAFSLPQVYRYLQLIYGALNVLAIRSHSGGTNSTSQNTACEDVFAELSSILLSNDYFALEHIVYPELFPIDDSSHCVIRTERLRLRREAVVTTCHNRYIVDSGKDILLYRTMKPPTKPGDPVVGDDSSNEPDSRAQGKSGRESVPKFDPSITNGAW
eukprot:CAMPEP_0185022862 /NCGR_PEP_ID=MMETSP1103-20130426/5561_1 /TAXON_ID=36769 /ORGANISM="Paraphysomonas bandaiensis, Strain Caron Lab Isolate" /LENGTH=924 /DNA_ID=CAMNT_0027555133 /DNA_START=35 /DNA_END=2806 /DNA_ORIENTATION=-